MMQSNKAIQQIVTAQTTQDGDGVKIRRIGGKNLHAFFDPFLLLDEINSDESKDYIGGFPPHPHRGFETITYMLAGQFRHRDSMGNEGIICSGGVQWMAAASGVIHSEMPEQKNGQLHGFQLWLNLPANEKMKAASYQDINAAQIPVCRFENSNRIKLIAGKLTADNKLLDGYIQGKTTEAVIADLQLAAHSTMQLNLNADHQTMLYVFQGALTNLSMRQMAFYGLGENLSIQAQQQGARVLLLSGLPLREPLAHYGPFVMNTMEEINQAIDDYKSGRLVQHE